MWGCLGKTLAAKVKKLQNRTFRIITRENYTTRSADILNKLGVPNLEKRRMQQLSILMYKVKNKLVPDYLCDMFTNVGDVHDHNTRQSGADLTLPKPKTNSMKNAFSYRGAEVWNCLSASLKASTTVLMYRNGQLNVDYHKQKSTLLISLVEGSLFKSPLLSEILLD